jgi:hypothetical protein
MPRSIPRVTAALLAVSACSVHRAETVDHPAPAEERPVSGRIVADFRCDAVYTGDAGAIVGTRWVHTGHGMPVTVLRIQSVPQVFLAFNTPPNSDRGEPHTGEHLLLGKGSKGKMLSLEQDMSLVESTAWTSATRGAAPRARRRSSARSSSTSTRCSSPRTPTRRSVARSATSAR